MIISTCDSLRIFHNLYRNQTINISAIAELAVLVATKGPHRTVGF